MIIKRHHDREYEPVDMDGCSGVSIARLFVNGGSGTWPNVRKFRLEPNGHTAYHRHEWPHQVMVERGLLTLVREGDPAELHGGDAVFVEPGERHQFRNSNHYRIHFYCIIPPGAGSP